MALRSARPVSRAAAALALAVALGAVALGVGASPALAVDDPVPADVRDAYSAEALEQLRTNADGAPDLTAAAGFGEPHRIAFWSAGMIAGDTAVEPIAPSDEWLAPVASSDGTMLGTYRVWRPDPQAEAELAGYDDDAGLARALATIPPGAALVNDAPSAAWFVVEDGIVSALNPAAAAEVPSPMPVAELTPVVAERYARAIQDAAGRDDLAGSGGPADGSRSSAGADPWIPAAVAALVIGLAAGAILVARRAARRVR